MKLRKTLPGNQEKDQSIYCCADRLSQSPAAPPPVLCPHTDAALPSVSTLPFSKLSRQTWRQKELCMCGGLCERREKYCTHYFGDETTRSVDRRLLVCHVYHVSCNFGARLFCRRESGEPHRQGDSERCNGRKRYSGRLGSTEPCG
jgi:hypothetical protein